MTPVSDQPLAAAATLIDSPVAQPRDGQHTPLADLRHDLRGALGNILGYGEVLIEEANESGHPDLVPDLEKIRATVRRLLAVIDERLDDRVFASPETALTPIPSPNAAPTPFPPPSLAREGVPATKGSMAPREASNGPAPGTPSLASEGGGKGVGADEPGYLLVVDDVEHNRDLLGRRLERQGHKIVSASNGAEALGLLAGGGFDLVLLDIMMPGMDGYEVLERVKANPNLRHTPVIMITALDELDSVVRCIEMGAADYLHKPFNPVLLNARVRACLRDKRAHDREQRLFEELQQNYKRLQELERLRDDLTGMIVHDLRTPLTSLLTGLQSLPMLGDLNGTRRSSLAWPWRAGKRCSA
jgi:sigma-B regulation protein RsbU (phosphoserine phosphatase)